MKIWLSGCSLQEEYMSAPFAGTIPKNFIPHGLAALLRQQLELLWDVP